MGEIKLPDINLFERASFTLNSKRLLILAEGFEKRSLSFISMAQEISFDKIVICKYVPHKESKYNELIKIISSRRLTKVSELEFNRYDPFDFEIKIIDEFTNMHLFDEIVIDISVMSKYMIMQIVCALAEYTGLLTIIYTEPLSYAPTEDEYEQHIKNGGQKFATILPSSGVYDIIRTPLLTSLIMQKSPSLLIAFLSFNEQLIRALLSEFNPMRLYLVNGIPPSLIWREKAMSNIHSAIIKEYHKDNIINSNGELQRKTSTLHFSETFILLSNIYREHCIENRIILAPTGSKMQTLGCALIKLCCQDIHIEYPTPESYYVAGYSSSEIKSIHQIKFTNFNWIIKQLSDAYKLNA